MRASVSSKRARTPGSMPAARYSAGHAHAQPVETLGGRQGDGLRQVHAGGVARVAPDDVLQQQGAVVHGARERADLVQ